MAEYKRPETPQEYQRNFPPKKPLMNTSEAYYESARCLYCYDAPCMDACPTHIDIPLFIKQINTGNVKGAAATIYDSNWLGNACGKVCPTEQLCEGSCVYTEQDMKPLQIGRLQNFATEAVMQAKTNLFKPGPDNGRRVAIVGAGPAGIACACELRVLGYSVEIFEAKALPTGLTVYGTAPYKITNEEALRENEYLQQQLGYTVHYNHPIQNAAQFAELEKQFDAVFLGLGLGATAQLNIPGEELPGVVGAVEFVEELRMKQHAFQVPERVVVIGGGNTAVDAASESARMGAQSVHLVYRRTKADMGAYDFEYATALAAGVQGVFEASPLRIEGENKASGVTFSRPDGSEFHLPADLVIKGTGQAKQGALLAHLPNISTDAKGRVVVDAAYQTTRPGYFAAGDMVNGGAEVVNAAYEGKLAAQGIHQWIQNKNT
jgi:glutamate synthase (NADPH/NADH) small chain